MQLNFVLYVKEVKESVRVARVYVVCVNTLRKVSSKALLHQMQLCD